MLFFIGLPLKIGLSGITMLIHTILSRSKIKKQTFQLFLLKTLFLWIILSILFEPISSSIFALISIAFIFFSLKKLEEDLDEDKTTILSFSKPIKSVSWYWNKLKYSKRNKGDVIVGSIYPFSPSDIDVNNAPVVMNEVVLGGSTLITGASGSGKTTTMTSMMKQHLDNGNPLVFMDFKGEKEIIWEFRDYCKKRGIEFYEFSSDKINFHYDPLKNVNETGKVNALMNMRKWNIGGADDHFRTSTQLLAQNIVRCYDKYREKNNDSRNYLVGLYYFMKNYEYSQNEKDGYLTILKMIEITLTSGAKQMFNPKNGKELSFEKDGKQFMVCFSFLSSNKELGNSLASFIFKDILDRGTERSYNPKLGLYIDEFGSMENTSLIKDILEKGRSARMSNSILSTGYKPNIT